MSNKKYAIFTMDVERFKDTECISSSGIRVDDDLMDGFDEYIKILSKHGIKSTLFTVGNLASRLSDQLRPLIEDGHELALHSYRHIPPMSVSVEEFRDKTAKAKAQMQDLFGKEVVGFRAPCFSMDQQRLNVLQELGFQYDSSHLDFTAARHTVKLELEGFQELRKGVFQKDNFFEFALSKEKIFGHPFPISGGGYVRLSNWSFIKTLIRHYIHKNDYYVFYLHPFELTRKKLPVLKKLKGYDQYYIKQGVRSYGRRIERIIQMLKKSGYEFITFNQMVQLMKSENNG